MYPPSIQPIPYPNPENNEAKMPCAIDRCSTGKKLSTRATAVDQTSA